MPFSKYSYISSNNSDASISALSGAYKLNYP